MPRREIKVVDGEFHLTNPTDCRDVYVTKAGLYQLFDIKDGRFISVRVKGFWNDHAQDDIRRIPADCFDVRDMNIKRIEVIDPMTGELLEVSPTDDLQCTVIYTIKRPGIEV